MSFDWNLSSDEENGFDDWANVNLSESLTTTTTTTANKNLFRTKDDDDDDDDDDDSSSEDDDDTPKNNTITTVAFLPDHALEENGDDDDDDDDDEVDWEDAAEEDGDNDGDTKPPADQKHHTLRPVTLDWTERPNKKDSQSKKGKSKRVARKRYRFEQLPLDLQGFLSNLEKVHLLALTSHAMYASKHCSEDQSLHLAHSLIPQAWMTTSSADQHPPAAPTEDDLSNFCNFFFALVNHHHRRRQQAWHTNGGGGGGMPRRRGRTGKRKKETHEEAQAKGGTIHYRTEQYCSYLSSREQDESRPNKGDTPDFNAYDKVQLFLSMVRSLGWRARYVTVLEPSQRDLDVSHPLFVAMSTRNVFQRLWRRKKAKHRHDDVDHDNDDHDNDNDGGGKKPAKRARSSTADNTKETLPSEDSAIPPALWIDPSSSLVRPICWVEVLCQQSVENDTTGRGRRAKQDSTHNQKPKKMHWIHVDPRLELVNQPNMVEAALYGEHHNGGKLLPLNNNKQVKYKLLPIPYALAVEHVSSVVAADNTSLQVRLTDVTPRYASSWVESLKRRGVMRGKQTKVKDSERVDKWWAATLKSVNTGRNNHRRMQELLKTKGKSVTDAIVLDEDDASALDAEKSAPKDTQHHDMEEEVDNHEKEQLKASTENEPIPTSKTAFSSHPIYVIPSVLNANEVLVPDAKKRVCGMFKGELVFRRTDVETALGARRWLYKGHKVKKSELKSPIKIVKARKKAISKDFKALKSYGVGANNDGSEEARNKILDIASKPLEDAGKEKLYASWQTHPWSPDPVGPSDRIPVNDFNNVELELLNPGLVHINEHHVAKVAKQLGMYVVLHRIYLCGPYCTVCLY
jgi:hypothetical protein